MSALPRPDTVQVRRARLRGITPLALQQVLARVPTPGVERFVFVRRLVVRAPASRLGAAFAAALSALARGASPAAPATIAYDDFAAVAVAFTRDALGGRLASAWQWRQLGVPFAARAADSVAALLAAYPRDCGTAVAALAQAGLLAAAWRDLSEPAATRLAEAIASAAGIRLPGLVAGDAALGPGEQALPEPVLARAAAFWAQALAGLAPNAAPVRAAALLALLRWAPTELAHAADARWWPPLLARLTTAHVPATPLPAAAPARQADPAPGAPAATALEGVATLGDPPPAIDPQLSTGWGGVLLLVNALDRLGIAEHLDAAGDARPSGWRVILDIAIGLGLPETDPLHGFLVEEDPETVQPPGWTRWLIGALEAIYAPLEAWPLAMAQAATLRATPTHLDLHFATPAPDLTTRLTGLDLDPGWVPWLGRVVTFHYDQVPTRLIRQG